MTRTRAIVLFIIGSIGIVAVILGVYFFIYATANTRGRVALHNTLRNPTNIQFNYEYFHNTCHSVIAESQQIKTLQTQVDDAVAHPPANDPFGQGAQRLSQLQTDLTGLKNQRDSAAQEYNAKSHEFTRDYMKSHDLPAEIGPPLGTPYDSLICEGLRP